MSRLPIRLRLTVVFALAMAVVLAATGGFLYLRLGASLDEAIDESLNARVAELAPRLAEGDPSLGTTIRAGSVDADERFVQIFDAKGRVVDGTPQLRGTTLLTPADVAGLTAGYASSLRTVDGVAGISGRARILATPVTTTAGKRVLALGASLEDRDNAVNGFLARLFIVGPAALLLASLLGYAVARAALRPVEAMRVEATAISGSEPGRRLPLPQSQDEVYRLGETLNEMLDRLESALERERSFVADAGHELRTPLALLKAELELALRRPRTRPELEEAIRSAAVETDRLAQLAEDLLLLARSDEQQLKLRREPVSARRLLERVAERFAGRAGADGSGIEVSAPADLELEADPLRLEQALGNLLDNALNHGSGSVRLTAVEQDGEVELHVTDEGNGFTPEFLPRAFDRFTRADDARSGDGTGLGLTIAQVIARAHGGTAHARSREGGGADVWVSIPRS